MRWLSQNTYDVFVTEIMEEPTRVLKVPAALYAIALAIGVYLTIHGNLASDRWVGARVGM